MRTHYEVLGVSEGANKREINAAYRRLVKKHHPDKGGDPDVFQQLTVSYNVLRSDSEREAYDFEHKFESYLDETSGRKTLKQKVAAFFSGRAFLLLSVLFFVFGVFLLDAGDGIHEDFNKGLVAAGCVAVLLSVGFFANRARDFSSFVDALIRSIFSILFFLFDVAMRVYLILVIIFSVVALLGLLNWLKRNYLHFLPHHF
jgi:curved DNA-binding protein CbpA